MSETDDRFDESLDAATHAVMAEFNWLDLPRDADERFELMVKINDALGPILVSYKP
jgi:hypothetical protein